MRLHGNVPQKLRQKLELELDIFRVLVNLCLLIFVERYQVTPFLQRLTSNNSTLTFTIVLKLKMVLKQYQEIIARFVNKFNNTNLKF